jgi:hypothetical protein
LGAIALATMVAAALHGPALAGLGLLAALASPALVATDDPSPAALVLYLAFVAGAALALARLRDWRWLAGAATAGSVAWGLLLLIDPGAPSWPPVAHSLIQTALAVLILADAAGRRDEDSAPDHGLAAILAAQGALAILVSADPGIGASRAAFAFALVAMLLAAGWRRSAAAGSAGVAAFVAFGILALWPVAGEAGAEPITVLPTSGAVRRGPTRSRPILRRADTGARARGAGLARVAPRSAPSPAAAAWHLGPRRQPAAASWTAYLRIHVLDRSLPFALAGAALAGIYAAAARFSQPRRKSVLSPASRQMRSASRSAWSPRRASRPWPSVLLLRSTAAA